MGYTFPPSIINLCRDFTIDPSIDIAGVSPRLAALAARASELFAQRFGRPARWVAAGPGRVNLIGEHVDYNDGFVLPMAIQRSVVIALDDAAGRSAGDDASPTVARVASADHAEMAMLDFAGPIVPGPPSWSNYVRGVVAGFGDRGVVVPAFDAMIVADLPIGGGLSSSAALEVATATVLEAFTKTSITPVEKALLCQRAEHEFAGVPCGIMDQFASVMGRADHLLLLDCRSRQTRHVAMTDESVSVLIVNSQVKHELVDGGYALRRKQCEEAAAALALPSLRDATMVMLDDARARMSEVVYRRARHVITEIARPPAAAAAIEASQWKLVGELMYASHASLRDDFEVSCDELDALVEIAAGIGRGEGDPVMGDSVIGCRMTGGGFGGSVVALVRSDRAEAVATQMAQRYEQRTGIAASWFTTRPAQGAQLIAGPGIRGN